MWILAEVAFVKHPSGSRSRRLIGYVQTNEALGAESAEGLLFRNRSKQVERTGMTPVKWIKLKIAAARGARLKPWHNNCVPLSTVKNTPIGFPPVKR